MMKEMNPRHDPPSPRLRAWQEEISSTLPADLDSLPRLHGFHLRGMQMTRLETFIDAAFAFAISMLVVALQDGADGNGALLGAFKNVPAFVASIASLPRPGTRKGLWAWSFQIEDGVSIFISWAM